MDTGFGKRDLSWLQPELFRNEPIYCEAPQGSDDEVLCAGSDDEGYADPAERIRRYETQAQRFLEGKPLFLLSASLRGPFDRKSGWQNPWRSGSGKTAPAEQQQQQQQQIRPATPEICLPDQNEDPEVLYMDNDSFSRVQHWRDEVVAEVEVDNGTLHDFLAVEPPAKRQRLSPAPSPASESSLSSAPTDCASLGDQQSAQASNIADEADTSDPTEVSSRLPEINQSPFRLDMSMIEQSPVLRKTMVASQTTKPRNRRKRSRSPDLLPPDTIKLLHYAASDGQHDRTATDVTEEEQSAEEAHGGIIVAGPPDPESPTTEQELANITFLSRSDRSFRFRRKAPKAPRQRPEQIMIVAQPSASETGSDTESAEDVEHQEFTAVVSRDETTVIQEDFPVPERVDDAGKPVGTVVAVTRPSASECGSDTESLSSVESPESMAVDDVASSASEEESESAEDVEHEESIDAGETAAFVSADETTVLEDRPVPERVDDAGKPVSEVVVDVEPVEMDNGEGEPSIIEGPTLVASQSTAESETSSELSEEDEQRLHQSIEELKKQHRALQAVKEVEVDERMEMVQKTPRKLLWPRPRQEHPQDLDLPPLSSEDGTPSERSSQSTQSSELGEAEPADAEIQPVVGVAEPDLRPGNASGDAPGNGQQPAAVSTSQPEENVTDALSHATVDISDDNVESPVEVEADKASPLSVHADKTSHQKPASPIPQQSQQSPWAKPEPKLDEQTIQSEANTPNLVKRTETDLVDSAIRHSESRPPASPKAAPPTSQSPWAKDAVTVAVVPTMETGAQPALSQEDVANLSFVASQALEKAAESQSPWAKGDSQLAAPLPQPFGTPTWSFAGTANLSSPATPIAPTQQTVPYNEIIDMFASQQLQPATPATRQSLPTPDFTLSIRSGMSSSQPSTTSLPWVSPESGHLPSTQNLVAATTSNPWTRPCHPQLLRPPPRSSGSVSSRTSSKITKRTKKVKVKKRVSWGPLPCENENEKEKENRRLGSRTRGGSPPLEEIDSPCGLPAESQKFASHFAKIMMDRRRQRAGLPPLIPTPGIRHRTPRSRLLPSASQQSCGSPEVVAMAEAFLAAEQVTVTNGVGQQQKQKQKHTEDGQRGGGEEGKEEEVATELGIEEQPRNTAQAQAQAQAQLDVGFFSGVEEGKRGDDEEKRWEETAGREESPVEEEDDVAAVLDNLDDFLNCWNVDAELAQARVGDNNNNQRRRLSERRSLLRPCLVRRDDDDDDGGGLSAGGVMDVGVWD